MFTGLIEEMGRLERKTSTAYGLKLEIRARKVLEGTKVGDSVAVDGVCLTITGIAGEKFAVEVVKETVERTTIAHWPTGQILNLERALSLQSRLGGHLVQGHIDGIGTIKTISRRTSETVFEIASDKYLARYIIFKGSITVDGISLTVASTKGELFKIAVIPHTWENTNLQFRKIGDKVNIETDVIARYVEKMMVGEGNTNNLSEENLRRAGF